VIKPCLQVSLLPRELLSHIVSDVTLPSCPTPERDGYLLAKRQVVVSCFYKAGLIRSGYDPGAPERILGQIACSASCCAAAVVFSQELSNRVIHKDCRAGARYRFD